jgi:hypothetical protein
MLETTTKNAVASAVDSHSPKFEKIQDLTDVPVVAYHHNVTKTCSHMRKTQTFGRKILVVLAFPN